MPPPTYPHPPSGTMIARRLFRAILVPFPLVCFTLALGTDILYWLTSHLMWQEFSAWLLLIGLAFGVAAAVVGTVAFLVDADRRDEGPLWPRVAGQAGVLALAFLNNLVHARDGWTAVVPQGLILSALTVIVLLVVAWLDASRDSSHERGVRGYV